jgi:glucosamine kinase
LGINGGAEGVMDLVIGIDGGGSGCRAAVADRSGRILGEAQGGPANIATDPDAARTALLACARDALASATGRDDAAALAALPAGLGLAGANAAGAADRLAAALPFRRLRIETDAMTAARGALGGADGLLAVIGTGSVFVRAQGGQFSQFGGWGFVLGDQGSGAALGRAALAAAVAAADGLGPASPYLATLLQSFGGPEGAAAFSLEARPADFGALVPDLFATDDPEAVRLVAAGAADIRAILTALQTDPPLPVTFVGGLSAHYAACLGDWPQRPPRGSGLDGALALARQVAAEARG